MPSFMFCGTRKLYPDTSAERKARARFSSFAPLWCYILTLGLCSLEAAANPEDLAQDTILKNLDPAEAKRLSHVRNIGIAVSIRRRTLERRRVADIQ